MLKPYSLIGLWIVSLISFSQRQAHAAPESVDAPDIAWSVLHPKPKKQMRTLNTDRPTKPPTPYTIDAGHFLMEMDAVNLTVSSTAPNQPITQTLLFVNSTMKLGLLDWAEIQISPPTMTVQNTTGASTIAGLGDSITRFKCNFLGNDLGNLSLALIPYVKIPNLQSPFTNGATEGGITLPGALALNPLWSLGFMIDWDFKKNANGSSYHHEGQLAAFISHSWADQWSSFVELYGQTSFLDLKTWTATLDTGTLYKLTPDVQFDVGINIGLTASAPALNPFLGFSFRL